MIIRYIWAFRLALARRCHDMAKQAYDNRKYSPTAWIPLQKWLNTTSQRDNARRLQLLRTFTARDTDLIELFAQCLWNLAHLPNLPWGRRINPQSYSTIRPTEKVELSNKIVGTFFFPQYCVHIYVPSLCCLTCSTGLGSRVCDSSFPRDGTNHEHTGIQKGCKL